MPTNVKSPKPICHHMQHGLSLSLSLPSSLHPSPSLPLNPTPHSPFRSTMYLYIIYIYNGCTFLFKLALCNELPPHLRPVTLTGHRASITYRRGRIVRHDSWLKYTHKWYSSRRKRENTHKRWKRNEYPRVYIAQATSPPVIAHSRSQDG